MSYVQLNADVKDVVAVFGKPNPREEDFEDGHSVALWRSRVGLVMYDGNEWDQDEMPSDGPDPYRVVTKDMDGLETFKNRVRTKGFELIERSASDGLVVYDLRQIS